MDKEYLQGKKDLTTPTKEYNCYIAVYFAKNIEAEDEAEAKEIVKKMFIDKHNIFLEDNDIKNIVEI